jgi:AcrR family transcriptional regulator
VPRLRHDERREQLMTVATRLFAEYGYDDTTTSQIARAAGVAEPVLYRHFPTKLELFLAIVRAVSRRTIERWQQLAAQENQPQQRLRLIARRIPSQIRRLADAQHVLHGAMAISRDRRVLAAVRDHSRQMERLLISVIAAGQKKGAFRRDRNRNVIARQLIYAGIGYAMIALNVGPADEQAMEDLANALLAQLEKPHARHRESAKEKHEKSTPHPKRPESADHRKSRAADRARESRAASHRWLR